jgi:hypothetical protein
MSLMPSANYFGEHDMIGYDSPLKIVMAVWSTFFKFEACQTAIVVSSGLPRLTHQVQILKSVPNCYC